jgi:hypothetical protein
VDVAPQRGDAVQVAAAVHVDEVAALAALDDKRLLLLPAPLLGERMPQEGVVVGGEAVRVGGEGPLRR